MKRGTPIAWSIKQISTMIKKGTIIFDNPVQRESGQWKHEDKSLLIHSGLAMFIPDVYAIRSQKEINEKMVNVYDIIDGIQRLTIFDEFRSDKWALTKLDTVTLDTGDTYDISGLKYSQLPEDVQEAVSSVMISFKIIELEEDDDEEEIISDIFYRLNNGKSVSRSHLALVAAETKIQKFVHQIIKNHPLFTVTAHFSEGSIKGSERQMAILQTIVLAGGLQWNSFGAKDIEKALSGKEVDDQVLENVFKAFDMLYEAFPEKSKFISKTNIVSFANLLISWKFSSNALEFLKAYEELSKTSRGKGKTKDAYFRNCGQGSTRKDKVEGRIAGLEMVYKKYYYSKDIEEDVVSVSEIEVSTSDEEQPQIH